MNLNNKGFGFFPVLLAILLISVIGFGGYYVWSQNKDLQTEQKQSPNNELQNKEQDVSGHEVPNDWELFEEEKVRFNHPSSWQSVDADSTKSEDYAFSAEDYEIAIYTSEPRMYYSSNAPYICRLTDNVWQDYQVDANGQTLDAGEVNACQDRVSTIEVNETTVYSISGGALGQARYVSVIKLSSEGYIVLSSSENFVLNLESDTESDAGTLAAEVVELRVQKIVEKLTKYNSNE